MATKYLDLEGLSHLWQKIKAYGDSHWGGGGSVLSFYPVGSYYETSDGTFDPNTAWGGTWIKETEGNVHVSAGTNYMVNGATQASGAGAKDGGSTEVPYHNHSVSSVNIASSGGHSHTITSYYKGSNAASGSARNTPNTGASSATNLATIASNTGKHTHSVPAHNTGYAGTSGDNNMPPYINVYRWHRTA